MSSIDHPSHYNSGSIEVIDYLKSELTSDQLYGFCIGNVIKYISRAPYKESMITDLYKAKWYLEYIINEIENKEVLDSGEKEEN